MTDGRRFHLKERIGAGAYGEVFLAEQDSGAGFRKLVALKLLHAHHAGHEDAHRRMRDEARILARLNHRNIVSVLDLVRLDNRWAVVMDYVPGADLERVLEALDSEHERCPPAAALEIGAAICTALEAAWEADDGAGGRLGVIHRDIKPSNVRLTPDGDVKVLDFGVARVNLDSREAMTGLRMGTERYMAPERIIGELDSPAGDVYAAAATVMELLLGRPLGRTPVLDERHAPFIAAALADVEARLHLNDLASSSGAPGSAGADFHRVFTAALHASASARPKPGALADDLHALARAVGGQDLRSFARSRLPGILARGAAPVAAAGTFSANSGDRAGSGTLIPDAPDVLMLPGTVGGGGSERAVRSADRAPDDASTFVEAAPYERWASVAEGPAAGGAAPSGASGATNGSSNRGVWFGLAGGGAALSVLGVSVALSAVVLGLWFVSGLERTSPPDAPPSNAEVRSQIASEPAPQAPVVPPPSNPEETPAPERAVGNAPVESSTGPKPRPRVTPSTNESSAEPASPRPDAPAPEVTSSGARVAKAQVTFLEATSLEVRCGEVSNSSSTSLRLRDFPAGKCTVSADYLGKRISTELTIERPGEYVCAVVSGNFTCK